MSSSTLHGGTAIGNRWHSGEKADIAIQPHAPHAKLFVEPDEIGALAFLDRPEFTIAAKLARGIERSHENGVHEGNSPQLHRPPHRFDHGESAARESRTIRREGGIIRDAGGNAADVERRSRL